MNGQSAVLSHISISSRYRVSKYGVDIDNLDRVGISALSKATEECDLIIIDEIGKMELFSAKFKNAVLQAIDSGKRVLGTVMLSSNPFVDDIKRHPQVKVITITRTNREEVLGEVVRWLREEQ